MPLYQIIDEFEPIRLMRQIEPASDDNLRAYLEQETLVQRQLARRGKRVVVICDLTVTTRPTPVQRKMYADWMRENEGVLASVLAGATFVVPSALVRGALTAIFWVAPLDAPHTVHARLDQALDWALERARLSELPMHERLARNGSAVFGAPQAAIA